MGRSTGVWTPVKWRIGIMLVVLTLCLAGCAGPARSVSHYTDAELMQIVADVTVLPITRDLFDVPPEERDAWHTAFSLSGSALDRLIATDDPRAVGLAIWLASFHRDLNRLLDLARFAGDDRATIRIAGINVGGYNDEPCTVSELIQRSYRYWFGAWFREPEGYVDFAESISGPEALVKPWVRQLYLFRERSISQEELELLKAKIETLDESIRWAVVTKGAWMGVYSKDEAWNSLRNLSPEIDRGIRARKKLALSDPIWSGRGWESKSRIYDYYIEFMSGEE